MFSFRRLSSSRRIQLVVRTMIITRVKSSDNTQNEKEKKKQKIKRFAVNRYLFLMISLSLPIWQLAYDYTGVLIPLKYITSSNVLNCNR